MSDPIVRKVLLTNDDGLDAPGLAVLEEIANAIAEEVWIAAPVMDASGTGSSVSIHSALRVYEARPRRYGVGGTPSDCVMVALDVLMKESGAPDLVLSGVNRGANLATDSHYSGTMGAAGTAYLMGVPAIALSQAHRHGDVHWDTARKHGEVLVRRLVGDGDWPAGFVPNINFPPVGPEDVTGYEVTEQGSGVLSIGLETRMDPRGKEYHWLRFGRGQVGQSEEADISAIKRGAVSITPIGFDRTDRAGVGMLKKSLGNP
ncbi:MAG: 5'/3'-nucleotidase SurE [Alphaproteobacteria bacterium]|nr:5'/3'-nucleotidase SurE [Alphaproteobacteria bacterium]